MRALVTGGTGFTGSHLVRRLLSHGHEVVMLDFQRGLTADELEGKGAELVLGSVTEREVVDRATKGCDLVYHLAAAFRQINAPDSFYFDVNVGGTRNCLEAAHKHGVAKFIQCSTSGVHSGDKKAMPFNEDSPINPKDNYQKTKWEGERVCHEYIKKGMDVRILRPTSEYGPGDIHGMRFLFKLVKSGKFIMFGDGKATVHPIYIDDLTDAFDRVTEKDEARGRTYLICNESAVSLNDLVTTVGKAQDLDVKIIHIPAYPLLYMGAAVIELLCKPFKITPPLFRRRVRWYRKVRAYRCDRAMEELGWKPKTSLLDGLRKTGEWYREKGYVS